MQTLVPVTGYVVGASGCTLFARILGTLGTPITPASISAITYAVTDLTTGLSLGTGSYAPSTAILPALVQNDPRWSLDSASAPGPSGLWGFNFVADVPATALPAVATVASPPPSWTNPAPVPHDVQVDVRFTPVSGQPFVVPWRVEAYPVFG